VQCVNLSDDELWRAIAANTGAMSELLEQRDELDAEIGSLSDPHKRSELTHSYVAMVNQFDSEYRAYAAELRRRHAA
jgi:hypothetical protein